MTDDHWERPDDCPSCGGDVQETAAGAECVECGRRVGMLDARPTDADPGGDGVDGGG